MAPCRCDSSTNVSALRRAQRRTQAPAVRSEIRPSSDSRAFPRAVHRRARKARPATCVASRHAFACSQAAASHCGPRPVIDRCDGDGVGDGTCLRERNVRFAFRGKRTGTNDQKANDATSATSAIRIASAMRPACTAASARAVTPDFARRGDAQVEAGSRRTGTVCRRVRDRIASMYAGETVASPGLTPATVSVST